jgi:hypothetical protein
MPLNDGVSMPASNLPRTNSSEIRLLNCARLAAKSVIEMPDHDADQIIRLLHQGNWAVDSRLRDEYPDVFAPRGRLYDRSSRLVVAIRSVFET